MAKITNIHDVSLLIEGDRISDFGPMEKYPGNFRISQTASDVNDASGKMVFPSFCDPHTHLVYSGSMEQEFSGRPGLCHMRKLQRGEECISASNPGKR